MSFPFSPWEHFLVTRTLLYKSVVFFLYSCEKYYIYIYINFLFFYWLWLEHRDQVYAKYGLGFQCAFIPMKSGILSLFIDNFGNSLNPNHQSSSFFLFFSFLFFSFGAHSWSDKLIFLWNFIKSWLKSFCWTKERVNLFSLKVITLPTGLYCISLLL